MKISKIGHKIIYFFDFLLKFAKTRKNSDCNHIDVASEYENKNRKKIKMPKTSLVKLARFSYKYRNEMLFSWLGSIEYFSPSD